MRLALLALLSGAMTGCGSADDSSSTGRSTTTGPSPADPDDPAADGAPLAVDEFTEDLVDPTRPTDADADRPARPDRTVRTRIVFPTGDGPYPLLVMSHGGTGHPDEYAEQIPQWAAAGFVVAAPIFPLTNRDSAGGMSNIGDWVNQPGDVSFVIDEVLAAGDDPDSPLHGRVDPESIGVVGHSLGGATTYAVAFNTATRDDRIDSVVVFAGLTFDVPGGEFEFDSGLPLLVLHGDADDVPIEPDETAWEQAASPKWFVTLLGADHRLAFTDEPSPWDDLVTRTILDFWHGTLGGDADALDRVTDDATDPELATVRHE